MEKQLSPLEQAKRSINPYALIRPTLARLAKGSVADITAEDDVVIRWHGFYVQRPREAGRLMLRIKVPGGVLTAAQLAVAAKLAAEKGSGDVDLTTRQNMEIHSLALAEAPAVFDAIYAAGLTTVGASGDAVRNVIGCPVADLDPEEMANTLPLTQELTSAFLGNAQYNLPRKFKISLCGCANHCVPTEINDVGLTTARNDAGKPGYALSVGGGLAAKPAQAVFLGWVAPEEVLEVVTHMLAIFEANSSRENRGHARVKHLIANWGKEGFQARLEERLGRALTPLTNPPALTGGHPDHLGVRPQRDAGLCYIGIPIPAGQVTARQAALIASLAEQYGKGRVRITLHQNLLLPDIPSAQAAAVLEALAAAGLPVDAASWRGGFQVCPGKEFCNKAAATTKSVAMKLLAALEKDLPDAAVTMAMSGCPNGCAHPGIADIGLTGGVTKGENGPEECFDVLVGGGAADAPGFGRRVRAKVRPDELPQVVGELIAQYRAGAQPGETFSAFARRALWPAE